MIEITIIDLSKYVFVFDIKSYNEIRKLLCKYLTPCLNFYLLSYEEKTYGKMI